MDKPNLFYILASTTRNLAFSIDSIHSPSQNRLPSILRIYRFEFIDEEKWLLDRFVLIIRVTLYFDSVTIKEYAWKYLLANRSFVMSTLISRLLLAWRYVFCVHRKPNQQWIIQMSFNSWNVQSERKLHRQRWNEKNGHLLCCASLTIDMQSIRGNKIMQQSNIFKFHAIFESEKRKGRKMQKRLIYLLVVASLLARKTKTKWLKYSKFNRWFECIWCFEMNGGIQCPIMKLNLVMWAHSFQIFPKFHCYFDNSVAILRFHVDNIEINVVFVTGQKDELNCMGLIR